jgi:imidazole glycerol-phosphate synthase subunit HisH
MVVVIDYDMGNVASLEKVFQKLGVAVKISSQQADIDKADYLVLPGVGAFGDGMKHLRNRNLVELLNKRVLVDKIPFLGVCIGMQLLGEKGYEFGEHKGLGWIKGEVIKLEVGDLRLPHVGWNEVIYNKGDLLYQNISDDNFYFVRSYYLKCSEPGVVTATCDYGNRFAASLRQDNIFATQFHPEKSQKSGLQVLSNFLEYVKN